MIFLWAILRDLQVPAVEITRDLQGGVVSRSSLFCFTTMTHHLKFPSFDYLRFNCMKESLSLRGEVHWISLSTWMNFPETTVFFIDVFDVVFILKREYKVYYIVIMKRGCRALALHSRGTWFDPLHLHIFPYYFSIFALRFNLMRYEHLYPSKLRFRNNWQQ